MKRSLKTMVKRHVLRPRTLRRYAGNAYHCSVCESDLRELLSFGDPPRANACCPVCGCLERHRLDWIFLRERTDLFDGRPKRFLHVAPEPIFAELLSARPEIDYLSGDLMSEAMVRMDITDIDYPDGSFSATYCSHVLEHVPDDRKAIAEFYRVLRPGGWALLQVPVTEEKTYEDPSITDPEERKKHFGQLDHVRACGPEYIERMADEGFDTTTLRGRDLLSEDEARRQGVRLDDYLFFCQKPSQ